MYKCFKFLLIFSILQIIFPQEENFNCIFTYPLNDPQWFFHLVCVEPMKQMFTEQILKLKV